MEKLLKPGLQIPALSRPLGVSGVGTRSQSESISARQPNEIFEEKVLSLQRIWSSRNLYFFYQSNFCMFLKCPQIVRTLNPTKSESFPAQNNCSPGIKKKHSSLEWKKDSKKYFFKKMKLTDRIHDAVVMETHFPEPPLRKGLLPSCEVWTADPLQLSAASGLASDAELCHPISHTPSPGAASHTRWLSHAGYKSLAMSAWLRTLWQAIFAPELPAKVAEALLGLAAVGLLPLPSPASTHFLPQVLIPNKHLYHYICFWRHQSEAPDLH